MNMQDQDNFEACSNRLLAWFLDHPRARMSPKVQLADFRGRGVAAVGDIDPSEELFVIPRARALSVKASRSQVSEIESRK
ncbi:MAG: hypothetical protein M1826_004085 [Phylliscum demangeonii]|nr:MAG: hypothetical protein M1826_004085 [Phylliscum demangeonii]